MTDAAGRRRTADATIRPATVDDIPEIRRILAAHEKDGPVAPGGVDIIGPYVRHFVERHRALVSELDGGIVAFGAVLDTGRARMLADLFVEPERLGQGLGRPLLAALFEDAPVRATFASSDPRALPLYVRAGMTPLWVCLYLEGAADQLPPIDPTLTRPGRDARRAGAARGGVDRRRATRRPCLLGRPADSRPVPHRGRGGTRRVRVRAGKAGDPRPAP